MWVYQLQFEMSSMPSNGSIFHFLLLDLFLSLCIGGPLADSLPLCSAVSRRCPRLVLWFIIRGLCALCRCSPGIHPQPMVRCSSASWPHPSIIDFCVSRPPPESSLPPCSTNLECCWLVGEGHKTFQHWFASRSAVAVLCWTHIASQIERITRRLHSGPSHRQLALQLQQRWRGGLLILHFVAKMRHICEFWARRGGAFWVLGN